MSLSTSRWKQPGMGVGSSWFCAHLGSVILHFLLLAQVWRASQQDATLHMAWVLAFWFLGTLLGSWQSSKDRSWRAGGTVLCAGVLLLAWTAWPKGAIPGFLVPGLWLLGSAMILALVMAAASTHWLGPSRPIGEGTRQMGEALHAIFALILVWSLPSSLIGALGVGLLIPLLISDGLQRKQKTPLPPRISLPPSQWRWDWWVVYLAQRKQLGLLLLAVGVGLLLDAVIWTVLTLVGAETSHHQTLGLLWYGIEGQLVAVLLGAYLVSVHPEVLGTTVHVIPVEWETPACLFLGSALILIAGSILSFSDQRLLTAWALPFILGGFTLGTVMWGRLFPRLCPPLSAQPQRLPPRPEEAPDFWVTVDAHARKRVDDIAGLLKVLCVPAIGWGIEQWGLSKLFLATGGTLIGLVLLAAGGWAMGRKRQPSHQYDAFLKQKEGRRGQMSIQPHTTDKTNSHRRGPRVSSLLWSGAILATGALLWWVGGGVPPLAWQQVAQLLSEHATSRPQFPLVLAQLATLLAAWGLLLILTMRVTARFWLQRPVPPSQHQADEHLLREQPLRQDTAEAPESASGHTTSETASASLPPQVTRAGEHSPPFEGHAQDSSPPVQVADVRPPSPLQPALFGEPLQFTVGSCSHEGMQQEPSTTAYLLTESGSDTNAAFSWPGGLFALIDRLPRDEPGHTRSCLAIETMRDTVIHACTGSQLLGEEALAALVAEHVQKVTRIIGQQSQIDDANPSMAAALIVGSQMVVANLGDARTYLCCSPEGFYQITDASEMTCLLTERRHPTSRYSLRQNKRTQHVRGSARSPAPMDYSSAVPLVEGDIALLCSDSVWSVLHATYLEHLIRSAGPDPSAICAALLLAARQSGSIDPLSMIVLSCHSPQVKIVPGVKQARGKH